MRILKHFCGAIVAQNNKLLLIFVDYIKRLINLFIGKNSLNNNDEIYKFQS